MISGGKVVNLFPPICLIWEVKSGEDPLLTPVHFFMLEAKFTDSP